MKTATLQFNSEKKHSVRYDASEKGQFVTSVYVMKTALDRPWPEEIVLKLEVK